MSKIWNKLINIGVQEGAHNRLNEHIRSVNFITLVWIPVMLLISSFCMQKPYFSYGILTYVTTLIIVLVLGINKNKNLVISTAAFLLTINFVLLLINVMLEFHYGTYLFLFPLFASVIYLFPLPRFKTNLALVLTMMASLHISSFIIVYEFPRKEFIATPQLTFTVLNHFAAFLLTFIIVIKYSLIQSKERLELDQIVRDSETQQSLLKDTLKDRNILLSEINHRTKNNLAIVSSILNLQRSQVHDEQLDNILLDCSNRVHSIASVHQKLYEKGDFSTVDFRDYMGGLINDLQRTIFPKDKEIKLTAEIESFAIKTDQAVSCALILNEVITNSIKYAFNEPNKDHFIDIRVSKISNQIVLMIHDNGPGFEFNKLRDNNSSLGMSLVEVLTEQLDGSYEYHNVAGTTFTLTFKLN